MSLSMVHVHVHGVLSQGSIGSIGAPYPWEHLTLGSTLPLGTWPLRCASRRSMRPHRAQPRTSTPPPLRYCRVLLTHASLALDRVSTPKPRPAGARRGGRCSPCTRRRRAARASRVGAVRRRRRGRRRRYRRRESGSSCSCAWRTACVARGGSMRARRAVVVVVVGGVGGGGGGGGEGVGVAVGVVVVVVVVVVVGGGDSTIARRAWPREPYPYP